MPLIKEVSPGIWTNEEGIQVRLNRAWITGGANVDIKVGLVVPDTSVVIDEDGNYVDEVYIVSSPNAYEISTVLHLTPPEEGSTPVEEYVTEFVVMPIMYPYFVYLISSDQGQLIQNKFQTYYEEHVDPTA